MSNENSLHVWYKENLVGLIERNAAGVLSFSYAITWLDQGFAISQQLPLSAETFSAESGKAHQFFANLLPEANARMHIVKQLKIANSDFELLKAIGGECAGALSILPIEHNPVILGSYKKLNMQDLQQILKKKRIAFNLTTIKDRPRLSLAGAQDKCPIFFDGEQYFLPKDSAASTHIIKFEIEDYSNVPLYEYFTTQLAASIGLPVATMQLQKNINEHFLLIKRYDRIYHDPYPVIQEQVERLHQEDFCQALGVSHEQKYEQSGGPSFKDCFNLIRQASTTPIIDLENLLRWQIFNVLAGNSDAHAKNIAILYSENHLPKLAPFYDIICTKAIEHIDTSLAMSIGGQFDPDHITMKNWENFAMNCDIRFQYLTTLIKNIANGLLKQFSIVQTTFENEHGSYPALQRIKKLVEKQCKKTLREFMN